MPDLDRLRPGEVAGWLVAPFRGVLLLFRVGTVSLVWLLVRW